MNSNKEKNISRNNNTKSRKHTDCDPFINFCHDIVVIVVAAAAGQWSLVGIVLSSRSDSEGQVPIWLSQTMENASSFVLSAHSVYFIVLSYTDKAI